MRGGEGGEGDERDERGRGDERGGVVGDGH